MTSSPKRTSKLLDDKIVQMKDNYCQQRNATPSPAYQLDEPLRVALPPIIPSTTISTPSVTASSFNP